VRFLVDAQLPRRLADLLTHLGHDVLHTLELPEGNRTSDKCLCDLSESERRVLITKDADFVDSFLVQRKPPHLLHVSTGNITNSELEALFRAHESAIAQAFRLARHVELCRRGLIVHE
jgi:predicted nuclease of predicted toxin-antitoxin system